MQKYRPDLETVVHSPAMHWQRLRCVFMPAPSLAAEPRSLSCTALAGKVSKAVQTTQPWLTAPICPC